MKKEQYYKKHEMLNISRTKLDRKFSLHEQETYMNNMAMSAIGKGQVPVTPVPDPILTMVFDDLAAFISEQGMDNTLEGWNTFFDTTTYADVPFTELTINVNTVILEGAVNLMAQVLRKFTIV